MSDFHSSDLLWLGLLCFGAGMASMLLLVVSITGRQGRAESHASPETPAALPRRSQHTAGADEMTVRNLTPVPSQPSPSTVDSAKAEVFKRIGEYRNASEATWQTAGINVTEAVNALASLTDSQPSAERVIDPADVIQVAMDCCSNSVEGVATKRRIVRELRDYFTLRHDSPETPAALPEDRSTPQEPTK